MKNIDINEIINDEEKCKIFFSQNSSEIFSIIKEDKEILSKILKEIAK